MKKLLFILIFQSLSLCNGILQAHWIKPNNHTRFVKSESFDKNKIFNRFLNLGSNSSENDGPFWEKVTNDAVFNVFSFAIAGKNIFAASNKGVYLSTNNGANWHSVNKGFSKNVYVNSIAVKEDKIFAGCFESGSFIKGKFNGGIYLSTNNGSSWKKVTNDTIMNVFSFAINGDSIYTGTERGIYLSNDNGLNWKKINQGLTNIIVYALVANKSNIIARTNKGNYYSTNGGIDWNKDNNTVLFHKIYSFMVNGTNILGRTIDGGVCLSTDNGSTWKQLNSDLPKNAELLSFTVCKNFIFLGTKNGVFFSSDNNPNWNSLGLTNENALSLAISGNYILAGIWGNIYRRSLSDIMETTKGVSNNLLNKK